MVGELVTARSLPTPPATRPKLRPGQKLPAALKFRLGRWARDELILFDDEARESWILYPPRSYYARRQWIVGDALVVEQKPWSIQREKEDHVVSPLHGCARHGIACKAQEAIQAAVATGFDPFS